MSKRPWLFSCLSSLLLGLSACSIYQAASITGGYSDNYMGNNTYKIFYKGNSATDVDAAKQYAMLRAAHLTLESHKNYFEVVSSENSSKQYQTFNAPTNAAPGIYNENTAPPTITTYNGSIVTHTRPEITLVIKMLNAPTDRSYDAHAVLAEK